MELQAAEGEYEPILPEADLRAMYQRIVSREITVAGGTSEAAPADGGGGASVGKAKRAISSTMAQTVRLASVMGFPQLAMPFRLTHHHFKTVPHGPPPFNACHNLHPAKDPGLCSLAPPVTIHASSLFSFRAPICRSMHLLSCSDSCCMARHAPVNMSSRGGAFRHGPKGWHTTQHRRHAAGASTLQLSMHLWLQLLVASTSLLPLVKSALSWRHGLVHSRRWPDNVTNADRQASGTSSTAWTWRSRGL